MNREQMLPAVSAVSVGLLIPLADASIKGAVLLALALGVTFLLRQQSAAMRHLAWVSALGLLLVLPILSAVLPGWNVLPEAWRLSWQSQTGTTDDVVAESIPLPIESSVPIPPLIDESHDNRDIATEHLAANVQNPAIVPGDIGMQRPATEAAIRVAEPAPTTSNAPSPNYIAIALTAIWLAGLAAFFARLVWSWLSLHHLTRTAEPITQGPVFDEFQVCCRELGVTRPVRLLLGDANAMPMAWGFVRSHILAPSVCEHWSSAQRRAVLLHELGHVLRRDPLWHGLVQVATAVYWFHPLVWLAAWRIHIERERACDDLVLNRGVGAHDYAGHLLDIVSNGRFRRIGASVGVAMASSNKLEGRVRSILDNRQDRRPLTRVLLTAGLLIAIAVGTPLAMMRAAERARDAAAIDKTDKTEPAAASEEAVEVNDETVAPDPAVHLQSARIQFNETMLVAWNERGALGLVFDSPTSEGNDANPTEVAYRWRFHDGTEEETTSEGTLPIDVGEQIMVFSGMSLIVRDATSDAATIAYDPNSVSVHPLDRTFFAEYDRQIPSQPELRPAVDLAEFLLPDESVQQQMRDDDYAGQGTEPGYPRAPLPFKIRYADNGLVVATPEGVAVFDFIGAFDRIEGNERRQGVEYRWRFVSADGAMDETGVGEVWELSRHDGFVSETGNPAWQSVYAESLHYIEAGPIHIPWSINYAEAGWIYYDPAWHGVWLIAPEIALELAELETNADRLQQFAFGPRAIPITAEVSVIDDAPAAGDFSGNDETTIRGFDLTPYLFTGEWTPLYEPGAPLDRDLPVADDGNWRCTIHPGEWRLHYSPVRGDFYVHRTTRYGSGQEVAEADYYGPIAGNPIELLGLEEYLAESINRHHATNAIGNAEAMVELQFLLTSENPTLIASGLRVLAALDELEIFEEVYLREMVADAAEWMDDTPEQIALLSRADATLKTQRALIEKRKVEIDDSEYAPGREPDADELAANWGEPVDGLSLAIVPWEQGEPTLRLGERVEAWLVVRNVSNEPIQLATCGFMESVGATLVDEESKKELEVLFPIIDIFGVPQRYELQPGQVLRIKNPAFNTTLGGDGDLSAHLDVTPGHTYRLSMSLQLPESYSYDEEGRITVPARGEFYNRLTSGTVRIRVAEIDGTVPPESGDADMNDDQSNAQPSTDDDSVIEELKIEVPADDYGNSGAEPTEEELALNWGPEVDGLRMAVLPWEAGEPSLRLAERVEAWLLLHNVSDEPIRFSTFNAMDNVCGALVDEETMDEQEIDFSFRGGRPVPSRYQLDPGDVMRIKQVAMSATPSRSGERSAMINTLPGHTYRLSMSLRLPEIIQVDSDGRLRHPARGEFSNRLEAGTVRIRVAEADGTVPPESGEADMNEDPSDAQSANDAAPGFRKSLHGFDLTPHRFTGDWEALFEIDGPLYRELSPALGGYWGCRVNSHAWTMYYSPLKQLFYVHLRDGDASEYFGPIEGDAIELLKIEEHLVNSFNRAIGTDLVETSFNLRYIESLIESREPTLMAGGFRALTQLAELSIYEEHYLNPLVKRVAEEAAQVPELSDLADAAVAYVERQHERIEALKVTIDDSEYTPGRAPTADELEAEWGPEVDGLALATMNWYVHPADSSTPVLPKPLEAMSTHPWAAGEVPTLAVGDFIGSQLVIRNVSDEPQRIATLNTMDGVSAIMTDEATGHSALLDYVHLTGIPLTERYLLQPGEVVTFKQSHISVVEGDLHPHDRPFNPDNRDILYGAIRVREGRSYTIDYSVDVPSAFSFVEEGRIELPAQGEFYNKLNAPPLRFEVASAVAANAVDDVPPFGETFIHSDDTGAMRLTPAGTEDREKIDQILVWGSNDHDGWRVGALLAHEKGANQPLAAGETALVRYFLQNITDEPRTITVTNLDGFSPTITAGGDINLNAQAGSETIEITAQPGEAVSPESYRVYVDTTGLPDGDYDLWSLSAFWIPNPDGNGSGCPWRVGRVPMKIGAGDDFAEAATDDDGIAWGGELAGLQFGIRMRDGQREWPVGSYVEVEVFARNLTDKSLTFTWDSLPPGGRTPANHFSPFIPVQTFTVEAGEQISLGVTRMLSVTESASPVRIDTSQLPATSDELQGSVLMHVYVESIPQFTLLDYTGSAPFEIVAAEPSAANATPQDDGDDQQDPPSDELSILHKSEDGTMRFTPTNEEERALVDQILTWTDAVEGWRVGAVLMNDLESDEPLTRGDTATVRYFMQNTTDQPMSITVAPIDGWSTGLRAGGWVVIETLPGRGPVEFTAQPGEAVSPGGFSVDVDTTGLADGKYELDATTVFWRQNADGNGASSPWRVAGVPVTIGAGGSLATETTTDDEGIHWGETASGLRLGMRMLDSQKQWAVGSLIEADLYVKNTTDQPITFVWDAPPPGEQGQTIYNADGVVVPLHAAFYTGLRPRNEKSFTVGAGEQIELSRALLQSVTEASTPGPSDPMQLVADSGKFYWVMNVFVQVQSVPQFGILLGSGTEEFEIVAAIDDETANNANPGAPDVIHEDEDGTMRLTPTNAGERELVNQILVWGSNDYDGWRVGALLVNDLDSDEPLAAGETAGVRYFLQNVTDQPKTILVAPMGDSLPVMGAGGRINLNTHAGSGTIELTAQPGEAVSPDGFYVLVDTTGLPDGEYELDSTAAFWMQNADGSGGTSPWRVGSVPMTIGAGGKFDGEPMTDDEGIVWGGTVAGLRVGMRLPEGEKQWAVGSLLRGDLFVKNTTTQSITFTWDKPAPLDQNQVVYTAEGEYVQLNSVFYTGARRQNPQTFTVEAGQQIALGDAKLQSVAVASQPAATDPSQLVAASGEFTWQVHVQLNVPTIPQFLFVVGSGPVPLEIVPAE